MAQAGHTRIEVNRRMTMIIMMMPMMNMTIMSIVTMMMMMVVGDDHDDDVFTDFKKSCLYYDGQQVK